MEAGFAWLQASTAHAELAGSVPALGVLASGDGLNPSHSVFNHRNAMGSPSFAPSLGAGHVGTCWDPWHLCQHIPACPPGSRPMHQECGHTNLSSLPEKARLPHQAQSSMCIQISGRSKSSCKAKSCRKLICMAAQPGKRAVLVRSDAIALRAAGGPSAGSYSCRQSAQVLQ